MSNDAIKLNDANYAEFTKEGRTFVQVWSERCGWCDKQKPISEKVVSETGIRFGTFQLNYFENTPSEFCRLYMDNQRKAPTLLVFQDGGLVGRAYKAILSEASLKTFLEIPYIDEVQVKKPVQQGKGDASKLSIVELKAAILDELEIIEVANKNLQVLYGVRAEKEKNNLK